MEHLKKILGLDKKSVDSENKTVRFLMSTDSVDREGEVLTKDGWILPANKKVPMIDSHKWWDGAKNAFAAVTVWQDDEGLWGEAKFASTQLGKDMFTLYAEDVLTQVSVGFLVYKAEFKNIEDRQVYHILEKELFELSAVILGANQDAAKKMLEEGRIGQKSFNILSEKPTEKEVKVEEMPSAKALDHLIEVSGRLKAHRKNFTTLCKLFNIDAMEDEEARIKALGEAITTMHATATKGSKGNGETRQSHTPEPTRTVSGKELEDLVRGATA